MSDENVSKWLKKRKEIWNDLCEMLEELNHMSCFDCGKRLTRRNASIYLDKSGLVLNCYTCTWKKVSIKDFWKRLFKR